MAAEIEVMIVGTAHLANSNGNCHNMNVGDVLAPAARSDIDQIVAGLARFNPTIVAVEASRDDATEEYARYLSGRSVPSPSETEQIAFRLAREVGLSVTHGVDDIIELPFAPVQDFAEARGLSAIWREIHSEAEATARLDEEVTQSSGLIALFRSMNEPSRIARQHAWYRRMIQIGDKADQPGRRAFVSLVPENALIFARIAQISEPGDRVLVVFGAGHAYLLRQGVGEMPGMVLVEPNDYLPACRILSTDVARPTGVEPVSPA